ncbi:MAG: metalloregulator ArsR/SmtB family transcription factor [Pseudomonadota bacterium]
MDTVFRAVSDPNRRAILDLLSEGERTVNDLLAHFCFTQPALSKHLKVLRDAGLVAARSAGRQRHYSLQAEGLRSVADWVAHYERFWNERLDALGAVLDEEASS